MSTDSGAPVGTPPASTRWLWLVSIATWISIVAIGLLYGVLALQFWRETPGAGGALYLAPLTLTLAPYLLILFYLRGKAQRKSLGLAAVTGWAGLIGAVLGGLCINGDMGFAGILFLPQVLLLVSAYRAHRALRHETGDQRKLREGAPRWGYLSLLAFLGFLYLVLSPGEIHSRLAANQASAEGSLRTINTSEITYAGTYGAGFSPSLAALAPPHTGAQPSATAAGLVDSVLASGAKHGYRLTYTAGPADKAGHIQTYTLTARPLEYGKTGRKNFFTDKSGVIRGTSEDRPATAKDPAVPY